MDTGYWIIILIIAAALFYVGARQRNALGLGVVPTPKRTVRAYQAVPAPAGAAAVTNAQQMMTSNSLNIGNAGGIVIIVPNEGHHGPSDKQTQFPNNAVFTPTNAIIPAGCEVVFLSDDEGHSHVITLGAMGQTKSLSVNMASAPVRFNTPGKFEITSSKYASAGQRGSITVSNMRAVANKVVGAIWVPQADQAKYQQMLSAAGCTVLSQANGTKQASGQNVTAHTLFVYQAAGTASQLANKLMTVTKSTPYT